MSVTLFEPALAQLLDSQEGEVGRYVQRLATAVEIEAQREVRVYFGGAPALTIDVDVISEMEGSTAAVGIKDAGNKSRRLARAQAEGKVNWLRRALDSVISLAR